MNVYAKILIPIAYLIITNYLFLQYREAQHLDRQIVGVIISNIGFGLWILARIQLGKSFSVMPKASALVKNGLYSKFKHPVYYCSIIVGVGLVVFVWNIYAISALGVLISVQLYRIQKEERLLQATFGEEYLQYKKQTWL